MCFMPVAARSPLRRLPVRPGDDLEQVAAGVVEVDAAAAVEAVDLAAALAPVVGVEGGARSLEARERRVELRLAHQEGAVVRPEIVVLAEVERDAVLRSHRHEMAPLPLHLHAEDAREELGRGACVLGGNDDVVELDGHGNAPQIRSSTSGLSAAAGRLPWRSIVLWLIRKRLLR